MAFTKITAAGIGSTETVTLDGLSVINNGSFGGNLTVGGVLTYEDVTNVDSVGLITARNGIVVGSGITLSKDGDVFFTGIATGNGSGLTALNASNLASGTVPTARLGSGTASSSTFLRGDSTFQTVNTDLVSDTSPQLGGALDTNGNNINFGDSTSNGVNVNRLRFGTATNGDLALWHDGSNSYIVDQGTGELRIRGAEIVRIQDSDSAEDLAVFNKNGSVELYHNNSKKIETSSSGVTISSDNSTGSILKGVTRFTPNDSTTVKVMWDETGFSGAGHFQAKDGVAFTAGDSSDLKIYHDGSHSYIADSGTGNLRVLTNSFTVNNTANSANLAQFTEGGSVELFHNGTKQCETSTNGLAFPSGKGIDFSATSDASGSGASGQNELLSDYEQGDLTFTVTSSNGGSISYSYRTGHYTRIGNVCHVSGDIRFDGSWSGSDGDMYISLPFTAEATGGAVGGGIVMEWNLTSSSYVGLMIKVDNNESVARVTHHDGGNNNTGSFSTSNLGSGRWLKFAFTYQCQ